MTESSVDAASLTHDVAGEEHAGEQRAEEPGPRALRLVPGGKHDMYREERLSDEPQGGCVTRLPNPFHLHL